MKNTNLVPELSQELQNRLQPFMPIVIRKTNEGAFVYECKGSLSREFWHEIREYLNYIYNPKNLVHFLSDDILQVLQDYAPIKIFRSDKGPYYTLNSPQLSMEILTNGDYKSDSPAVDNIDSKLWRAIARELNEACSKSKVDEFAKEMVLEPEKINVTLHELETVFNTLFNHGFHNVYELKVMTAIGLIQQIKRELK